MRSSNLKKEKSEFEPSMKILMRTLGTMLESGSIGKLALSQTGKINYPRLNKHLDWLTKKQLIEAVLEDNKMKLRLTQKGKDLAITLCSSDFKV